MTVRFRFGIGPFRFSYRLTRTKAQKRAATCQRAARRQARAERKFDPREHIKVTETPLAVHIDADVRGLSPGLAAQVLALGHKLEAEHAGIPVKMPARSVAAERAAREHAGRIAEIVAMTDDQAQADALAAIQDPALQSAAIRAVLQDEAGHAGDTG